MSRYLNEVRIKYLKIWGNNVQAEGTADTKTLRRTRGAQANSGKEARAGGAQ